MSPRRMVLLLVKTTRMPNLPKRSRRLLAPRPRSLPTTRRLTKPMRPTMRRKKSPPRQSEALVPKRPRRMSLPTRRLLSLLQRPTPRPSELLVLKLLLRRMQSLRLSQPSDVAVLPSLPLPPRNRPSLLQKEPSARHPMIWIRVRPLTSLSVAARRLRWSRRRPRSRQLPRKAKARPQEGCQGVKFLQYSVWLLVRSTKALPASAGLDVDLCCVF